MTVVPPLDAKHGPAKDARQTYRVPLNAVAPVPPALRDSALIFYRQGTLTMGLAIDHSVAAIDIADFPVPPYEGGGHHQLWYKEHIRLTGNAPFAGVVHNTFHNVQTGQDITLSSEGLTLSRDETLHSWSQADMLAPGQYLLIVTYDSPKSPTPMKPAVDTIRFTVPQHD